MYAMTLQCEIPEERTLVVKFPDSVQPGTHEVMVIVDAPENVARVRAALRILEDDAVSERSATTTSPVTR